MNGLYILYLILACAAGKDGFQPKGIRKSGVEPHPVKLNKPGET